MLVLSRRETQKVRFPGLGISVEILQVQGSKVRLGINAPLEVRVLRDELRERGDAPPAPPHVIRLPQTLRHELRNTLHELSLMLHVYRMRAEQLGDHATEETIDPEQMFEAIVDRLRDLGDNQVFTASGLVTDGAASLPGDLGEALIVDDDANERELLAGFLRMCGYRGQTASDGIEALDLLESGPLPSFVLLDMQMPRCDGRSFLRQMRQREEWNAIHVFVVSGRSAEELGVNENEFTRWLQKPLDPRRVVEELAKVECPRQAVCA